MFENHSIPLDVASTNVDSLNTTYTPIKDPLDAATAPPEEVIPEPIAEPPQVTEIDFTPDPEGDNTVEEITTSPPPTNDDPFSDPVFDSQIDVYAGAIALLDEGISTLNSATAGSISEDIYFGGDKAKWIAAAYTLKARFYLHQKNYASAFTAAYF